MCAKSENRKIRTLANREFENRTKYHSEIQYSENSNNSQSSKNLNSKEVSTQNQDHRKRRPRKTESAENGVKNKRGLRKTESEQNGVLDKTGPLESAPARRWNQPLLAALIRRQLMLDALRAGSMTMDETSENGTKVIYFI